MNFSFFSVKPAPVSKIFAESISSTSLTLKWENSHPDRFQIYGIFSSDEWTSHNFSVSKIKDYSYNLLLWFHQY